jgi:hypothetical protein
MSNYGGADKWQTLQDTYTKNQDDKQEKADAAAVKKAETQKYKGDDSLIGGALDNRGVNVAYLNSLEPGDKSVINGLGTGQIPLFRYDYLLARNEDMMKALIGAFPQFSGYDPKAHMDTVSDFTGKGKTAQSLTSAGTAFSHLKRVYDNTTFGSRNPATAVAKDRTADAHILGTEVSRYYQGGAPHADEVKKIGDDFEQSWYSLNRQEAPKEYAKLMWGKYENFQQQWENAQPPLFRQPMPDISSQAKVDAQYLINDGHWNAIDSQGNTHPAKNQGDALVMQQKLDADYRASFKNGGGIVRQPQDIPAGPAGPAQQPAQQQQPQTAPTVKPGAAGVPTMEYKNAQGVVVGHAIDGHYVPVTPVNPK